jgi:hypothetical protein
MKPMNHKLWAVMCVVLIVALVGVAAAGIPAALIIARGEFDVAIFAFSTVLSGWGAVYFSIALRSELRAIGAHKRGVWCGHKFCGFGRASAA